MKKILLSLSGTFWLFLQKYLIIQSDLSYYYYKFKILFNLPNLKYLKVNPQAKKSYRVGNLTGKLNKIL